MDLVMDVVLGIVIDIGAPWSAAWGDSCSLLTRAERSLNCSGRRQLQIQRCEYLPTLTQALCAANNVS